MIQYESGHTSGSQIKYCLKLIFSLSKNDYVYTDMFIEVFNISKSFPRSLHQVFCRLVIYISKNVFF